ncbi:MAG: hypothetical protein ACK2T0_14325 [Anaerolineales bacterium]|jgi:hypothetical protein
MMSEAPDSLPADSNLDETFPRSKPGIFDFTPEDLRSNRAGYVSQRQREWLNQIAGGMVRSSRSNAIIALGFVFLGLALILILYMQNESSRAALLSSSLNLLLVAGAVGLVLIILVLAMVLTRRRSSAVAEAHLQKAEGVVRLEQSLSPGSSITSYYVFVGKQRFAFSEDMSSVFPEGRNFRVYFIESGPMQLILSLEQLRT